MDDNSAPALTPRVLEDIAAEQDLVHERFWEVLKELQNWAEVKSNDIFFQLASMGEQATRKPAKSKRPGHLIDVLTEYACHLFLCEFRRYPDPVLQSWYTALLEKSENLVLDNVVRLGALEFHATHQAMRDGIRRQLPGRLRGETVVAPPPRLLSPPGQETEAQDSEIAQQTPRSGDDLVERRRQLLSAYKQATGHPSDRSIYTARNSINKPEFMKWRKGLLPESSKTTKKFDEFLRRQKPPIRKLPK